MTRDWVADLQQDMKEWDDRIRLGRNLYTMHKRRLSLWGWRELASPPPSRRAGSATQCFEDRPRRASIEILSKEVENDASKLPTRRSCRIYDMVWADLRVPPWNQASWDQEVVKGIGICGTCCRRIAGSLSTTSRHFVRRMTWVRRDSHWCGEWTWETYDRDNEWDDALRQPVNRLWQNMGNVQILGTSMNVSRTSMAGDRSCSVYSNLTILCVISARARSS